MLYLKIILFTLLSGIIYASNLSVDNKTQKYELLKHSQIYIDKTRKLEFTDILKQEPKFQKNDKPLLGFGYSPDFNVWIKFTLENKTNKSVDKVLEYANAMTTHIEFYDNRENKLYEDGLLNINESRKSINPIFHISLAPKEKATFYIKASSHITTLIVKLNLWDYDTFFENEVTHQVILALFFGAMGILGIYNFFIYFFTRDINYLYYVMYIGGIMIHHMLYTGIGFIYVIEPDFIIYIVEFAVIFIMFPVFALALFTKSFLETTQYKKLDIILTVLLILLPISLMIFLSTDIFNKFRNLFSVMVLLYLIFITIYAAYKKNRQAYFILFGWFVIFVAILFMFLSSFGIFSVYEYVPYLIESALILEVIVFSIALADRIKQLQVEKQEVSDKLIEQQENEKVRLTIKVKEKTQDLETALGEKELLLKELNHRVKNNMQMIVSLIRLQNDEIEDDKYNEVFLTIQNRINAMSHLHELLYKQDNLSYVDAYEYFEVLGDEVRESYNMDNININFDIDAKLKIDQAIYCGLILNELITNSFKYAFVDSKGENNIDISLKKVENKFHLIVSDDGVGYNKDMPTNSLGLVLINTLAKEQLRGEISMESTNGVKVEITWSSND